MAELTQLMRRDTFERIPNVTITDEAWAQITLPVKLGGFGSQSTLDIASWAYLSSSISCHDLISALLVHEPVILLYRKAVADWRSKVNPDEPPTPECHHQKSWTEAIAKGCQQLLAHADDIPLARLRGCVAPGSGDWLKALPSSGLGLSLTNDQFRIGCALRLGAHVSFAHTCVCGTNADEHVSHALICKSLNSRFTRHEMGKDFIRESLKSACIPSTLEPTGLIRNDGPRPRGVTMLPWSRGRSLAWDFPSSPWQRRTCSKGTKKAPLLLQPRKPSNDSNIMIFPSVTSSNLYLLKLWVPSVTPAGPS